jgi:hypothetical protein
VGPTSQLKAIKSRFKDLSSLHSLRLRRRETREREVPKKKNGQERAKLTLTGRADGEPGAASS